MSDKKFREFWLNTRMERIYTDSDASCPDDEIHVIEYSAYLSLKDENKKLHRRLDELEISYSDCCIECQSNDELIFNLKNELQEVKREMETILGGGK